MKLDPKDIQLSSFPKPHGILLRLPQGVTATHKPSGKSVSISHCRNQYKNKQIAVYLLEKYCETLY